MKSIQDKDATNYQKELTQVWDESRSEEQLLELPKEISCPLNFLCFFRCYQKNPKILRAETS